MNSKSNHIPRKTIRTQVIYKIYVLHIIEFPLQLVVEVVEALSSAEVWLWVGSGGVFFLPLGPTIAVALRANGTQLFALQTLLVGTAEVVLLEAIQLLPQLIVETTSL